jgi:hypothetical protein
MLVRPSSRRRCQGSLGCPEGRASPRTAWMSVWGSRLGVQPSVMGLHPNESSMRSSSLAAARSFSSGASSGAVFSSRAPAVAVLVIWFDDDESQSVWDEIVAACVVERTLFAAMHAADGDHVWLVQVCDLQLVLDLAMFHEKAVVGPVRIYGQACSTTFGVRVAVQPMIKRTRRDHRCSSKMRSLTCRRGLGAFPPAGCDGAKLASPWRLALLAQVRVPLRGRNVYGRRAQVLVLGRAPQTWETAVTSDDAGVVVIAGCWPLPPRGQIDDGTGPA